MAIRVRTQPGKRDELFSTWERHLAERVRASEAQVAYSVAYDDADADVLHLVEVYADATQIDANAREPWFADYMREAAPLLAGPPQLQRARVVWRKP